MTIAMVYRRKIAARLDNAFLSGRSEPDFSDIRRPLHSVLGEPSEVNIDLELIEAVLQEAISDVSGRPTEGEKATVDAWLAARLHYAIRFPRRLASSRGFWTWLSIEVGQPYLRWRYGPANNDNRQSITQNRFHGPLNRNALSRLWWGAEMIRNGPDYENVELLFRRAVNVKWALELEYSWYRPAAIAFMNVAEGIDGGDPLSDNEQQSLSVRLNSYLSLTALEAMGLNPAHEDYDASWRDGRPSLQETLGESLSGPNDGRVDEKAVKDLARWYRSLLSS
jgi:hypothetical protein